MVSQFHCALETCKTPYIMISQSHQASKTVLRPTEIWRPLTTALGRSTAVQSETFIDPCLRWQLPRVVLIASLDHVSWRTKRYYKLNLRRLIILVFAHIHHINFAIVLFFICFFCTIMYDFHKKIAIICCSRATTWHFRTNSAYSPEPNILTSSNVNVNGRTLIRNTNKPQYRLNIVFKIRMILGVNFSSKQ
jgi:hypothetical protein